MSVSSYGTFKWAASYCVVCRTIGRVMNRRSHRAAAFSVRSMFLFLSLLFGSAADGLKQMAENTPRKTANYVGGSSTNAAKVEQWPCWSLTGVVTKPIDMSVYQLDSEVVLWSRIANAAWGSICRGAGQMFHRDQAEDKAHHVWGCRALGLGRDRGR